ncbi:rod-binding protein [Sphingomonas panacisoli]|uniref:Rod-binding protein n=1 Tax=Sphingomonas panacisoli TaxID=1813879 RepID=A0A5B8LK29_9SPHN|nr:rod-binding protein [Sphingomonas panacisoli]QDZ08607.1 rod-binding protein [Sphingomonas panacisoli]
MTDLPSTSAATPTTGISTDTSRLASSANLKKAGEKFESVFIGLMLKSMRQAKLGDGLFDSKNSDTFRDMQDKNVAESMAAHQPIGIGKAMTDFLARSQAALKTPVAADPSGSTTP